LADYRLYEGQALVKCGDCEIVLFVCDTNEYRIRYAAHLHHCPKPHRWRIRGSF